MTVFTASEPEAMVLATAEGQQLEAQVFRNSEGHLVVQSKLGMNFVLDRMSTIEVCKRLIIILTAR